MPPACSRHAVPRRPASNRPDVLSWTLNCRQEDAIVCRNIKTLFNFDPPATEEEIQASALQYVRKLSGFNKPSKINEAAFNLAVEEVTEATRRLVHSLVTLAPPRNREEERAKAAIVAAKRFGTR
jgi:hypothetical protein